MIAFCDQKYVTFCLKKSLENQACILMEIATVNGRRLKAKVFEHNEKKMKARSRESSSFYLSQHQNFIFLRAVFVGGV